MHPCISWVLFLGPLQVYGGPLWAALDPGDNISDAVVWLHAVITWRIVFNLGDDTRVGSAPFYPRVNQIKGRTGVAGSKIKVSDDPVEEDRSSFATVL